MSDNNANDPAQMAGSGPSSRMTRAGGPTHAETRLARQKAALKANMGRRKAQARAWDKAGGASVADGNEPTGGNQTETGDSDKE